jgi:hypothetical protein
MSQEPAPECPVEQRKLLIASGLFIEAMGRLALPPNKTGKMPTGEFILYAIWFRLLETARSIQQSCYAGYAREQQPLARSMVNSACDLMFIAEKDTPSRALLWGYFSIERRKRIGQGYVQAGMVRQDQLDAFEAEATAKEKDAIAELEAEGVKPYPKFNQNVHHPLRTWTGLSDADLIKKVGRNDWYEGFYVPFSDASHGNVLSAVEEIHQLRKGPVIVGPRYSPLILFHVVMCVRETLTRALETLNRHFDLGNASEIDRQDRTLLAGTIEYQPTIKTLDPAEL